MLLILTEKREKLTSAKFLKRVSKYDKIIIQFIESQDDNYKYNNNLNFMIITFSNGMMIKFIDWHFVFIFNY